MTLGRLLRFAAVGGGVALVYMGAALALSQGIGLSTQASSWIAYVLAVLLQYVGHSCFTFGMRLADPGRALRFGVVIASGSAASLAVVALGEALGLPEPLIYAAVMAAAIAINVLALTFWVYAARGADGITDGATNGSGPR